MSMMISELYDALKEAGASDDKARNAASAVAEFESTIQEIKAELKLQRWMIAFNLAFTMAIVWKVFT